MSLGDTNRPRLIPSQNDGEDIFTPGHPKITSMGGYVSRRPYVRARVYGHTDGNILGVFNLGNIVIMSTKGVLI